MNIKLIKKKLVKYHVPFNFVLGKDIKAVYENILKININNLKIKL